MTIAGVFARSLIGPVFLTRGAEGFLHPAGSSGGAIAATRWLESANVRVAPEKVARAVGAVQVGGAALFVLGRTPRLAATMLAFSVLPELIAGNSSAAAIGSLKRLGSERSREMAILGGLLFAATDRKGAPSLRWRANRAGKRASSTLENLGSSVADRLSAVPVLGDR